jgi:hypothetical protein
MSFHAYTAERGGSPEELLWLDAQRCRAVSSALLFAGCAAPNGSRICFETFPQAVACALAGSTVSAKGKATIRRGLLHAAGIDVGPLKNVDSVDAALCALTAHHFLAGSIKTYGDPETGLIVVPANGTS